VLWDITAERAALGSSDHPHALNFQVWADSQAGAEQAAQADISANHPQFAATKPSLTIRTWADAHRNSTCRWVDGSATADDAR
jgi:hypothetical protein